MKKKPTRKSDAKGKVVRDLPLEPKKASDVKGGAILKFGDIKGESTDKDHKDWVI
jgi:hypothetical protein